MTEILLDKPSRARHEHPVGRARGCCPVCAPDAYAMLWARHRANVPLDLTGRPLLPLPVVQNPGRAFLRLGGVIALVALIGLTAPAAHGEDVPPLHVPAWANTDIPPTDLLPDETRKVRTCKPNGNMVVRTYTRTQGLGPWHLTDKRVKHDAPRCDR